jgi:hypothetical protein
VSFSADGRKIISGDVDGEIRVWHLDGTLVNKSFKVFSSDIGGSINFSPSKNILVSGNCNGEIRLWKLDGTPIKKCFKGSSSYISSIAFSPNGRMIVSGSDDTIIRLWDIDGSSAGKIFEGHSNIVNSLIFSPDGNTIISGSSDKTIRLWDLDGTSISKPFEGHSNVITAIAISPDGDTLISGSDDKRIGFWKNMSWRTWLRTCCQRLHSNWEYDPHLIACKACLTEEAITEAEVGNFQTALQLFEKSIATETLFPIVSEESDQKICFDSAAVSNAHAKQKIVAEAKCKVAPYIVQHGELLAHHGEYKQALEHFILAKIYDPQLGYDPDEKAKQVTVPILMMQAEVQLLSRNREAALIILRLLEKIAPQSALELQEILVNYHG